MTAKQPIEIRLEIARLHWEIQEYGLALDCFERALKDDSGAPELRSRLEACLGEAVEKGVAPEIIDRIRRSIERLSPIDIAGEGFEPSSPIATPTLAGLLADQGHADKALAVATSLLEQDPDDERALAVKARLSADMGSRKKVIDELSRWLGNARRRRQGRAKA